MTYFLGAEFIRDQVHEIFQHADQVARSIAESGKAEEGFIRENLMKIRDKTRQVLEFMDSLQCQPLIYTGEGSTEEVIGMLNRLMALSDKPGG